jgi:hypothetical protein
MKNQEAKQHQKCVDSIKRQNLKNAKVALIKSDLNTADTLNKIIDRFQEFDFISFIKADEEYADGYFEKVFEKFQKYQAVAAVYTDFQLDGIRKYLPSFNRSRILEGQQIPYTAIFKREVFDQCGKFDSSLEILETWDMWIRISEKFPAYHLPESLYQSKKREVKFSTGDVLKDKDIVLTKMDTRLNG